MDAPDRIVLRDLFNIARFADDLHWQPFREGVQILRLYGNPENGPSAALLRYAPGASLPRHFHLGYEHIIVLFNSQQDDLGNYSAGTLIVNPPGSSHTVSNPDGCIALVIWEKPVTFEDPPK